MIKPSESERVKAKVLAESADDQPIVSPPDTMSVEVARRVVLYDSAGRPLGRAIGYRHE